MQKELEMFMDVLDSLEDLGILDQNSTFEDFEKALERMNDDERLQELREFY